MQECNDAMLGVYMSSVTKGVYHMHEVIEKLNVISESGSGGRRFAPPGPMGVKAPPGGFAGPGPDFVPRARNAGGGGSPIDFFSGSAA